VGSPSFILNRNRQLPLFRDHGSQQIGAGVPDSFFCRQPFARCHLVIMAAKRPTGGLTSGATCYQERCTEGISPRRVWQKVQNATLGQGGRAHLGA
jgi:hypothetical protein